MSGDVYIDVVPFTSVSNTTKDVVSGLTAGRTPKAVIIFGGRYPAASSGGVENVHMDQCIGFAVNGGGKYTHGSHSTFQPGGGWTQAFNLQMNNYALILAEGTGGADTFADVSFITDGVRLAFSLFSTPGLQFYAMIIAGNDVEAYAGDSAISTASGGGTTTVSSVGFQPDLVLSMMNADNAAYTTGGRGDFRHCFGAATPSKNYCVGMFERNDFFASGTPPVTAFYNDAVGFQPNVGSGAINWKVAVNNFTSSGFDIVNTGGTAGGDKFSFLALKFDGRAVDIAEFANETSTGVATKVTGLSFRPGAGLVACSGLTSVGAQFNTDEADSVSYGMWADQVGSFVEGSQTCRVPRNVNRTTATQIALAQCIRPGSTSDAGGGTVGHIDATRSGEIDIDYTAVSGGAERVFMVLFEAAAPPSIEIDVHQQGLTVVAKIGVAIDVSQQGVTVVAKLIAGIDVHQQGVTVVGLNKFRPYPYMLPEEPITETWKYTTDIIESIDGGEQRVSIRSVPTIETTHKHASDSLPAIRAQFREFFKTLAEPVPAPRFTEDTRLTASTAAGHTRIYFDPQKTNLRERSFALLYDVQQGDITRYQIVRVQTLLSDGAVLSDTVGYAFTTNTKICPCSYGFAGKAVTFSRVAPDTYGVGDLVTMDSATIGPMENPADTPYTLPFIGDYPLLDRRPVGARFDKQFDAGLETQGDDSTGVVAYRNLHKSTKVQGSREYLLRRFQGATDIQWVRAFADYTRGSWRPFLVPSWRGDFDLADALVSEGTTIKLAGPGWIKDYWPLTGWRHISLETPSGLVVRRVTGVRYDEGDSVLTLAEALPVTVPTVLKVMACPLTRIGGDVLTMTHYATYSQLSLTLRTVDA